MERDKISIEVSLILLLGFNSLITTNAFQSPGAAAAQTHRPPRSFPCIIIIIILFCLLVPRLLTGCKILLQLGLAAVPGVSVRGEREMSKHLSDHRGAHAGATGNCATSPCQLRLLQEAQSGTAQRTSLLARHSEEKIKMRNIVYIHDLSVESWPMLCFCTQFLTHTEKHCRIMQG